MVDIALTRPVVSKEELIRGFEYVPSFNESFYSATGLNAWDIDLPAAYMTPVFDGLCVKNQGSIGSCTGFSSSYLAEIHYMLMTGDRPTSAEMAAGPLTTPGADSQGNGFTYEQWYPTSFSPMSTWHKARIRSPCGSDSCGDCGAAVGAPATRDGVLDVYQYDGMCRASTWKTPFGYGECDFNGVPGVDEVNGETAAVQSANHKITSYFACTSLEEMKLALYLHGGAISAMTVFSPDFDAKGNWSHTGQIRGYHAIAMVGWDANNSLININSWGLKSPKLSTMDVAYQNSGGLLLFASVTPAPAPRLPGREVASPNPIPYPLLAVAGLGIVIGGYAVYKMLKREGATPWTGSSASYSGF